MIWMWTGFLVFVGIVLALDLGVFNRTPHAPTLREALLFTAGTVVMALGFGAFIYFAYNGHWLGLGSHLDAVDGQVNDGRLAAVKFLTGYVVELSLSMDNVFVIALIFQHLKVPSLYQHRVLRVCPNSISSCVVVAGPASADGVRQDGPARSAGASAHRAMAHAGW